MWLRVLTGIAWLVVVVIFIWATTNEGEWAVAGTAKGKTHGHLRRDPDWMGRKVSRYFTNRDDEPPGAA